MEYGSEVSEFKTHESKTSDTAHAEVEMTIVGKKGKGSNSSRDNDRPEFNLVNGLTIEQEIECGMLTVLDVDHTPDVNRDNDDVDGTLPIERRCRIPEEIIVKLPNVNPVSLKRVQIDTGGYSKDIFNDLGQGMYRDGDNRVHGIKELADRVNTYDYDDTCMTCGDFCGYLGCIATLGMYPCCCKKRVVGPDQLGHHRRNGKDLLHLPGRRVLWSCNDHWVQAGENNDGLVPKDDERNPIRKFGPKTVVTVGENCIGGARFIGTKDGVNDGDYVVLGQGRHVLNEENYSNVKIVSLTNTDVSNHIISIGPLTILYVKEGYIGGAYHRVTGRYKLFLPGPPYIFHNKNFEQIECVNRGFGTFKIGPVQFTTVKDGELGGAYHKKTGLFQVLEPGKTYILHNKDYETGIVVERSDEFELGPYNYVTVRPGYVAGARRIKGGRWIDFNTGETYQCNKEDYNKPECVKLDSHCVKCGPKTWLTVKKGTLNGATDVKTGEFVEFTGEDKTHVLHEKEYRDVITIPIISDKVQTFGPNKIVTINEGYAGPATKGGKLEILSVGTHKLSYEYNIDEPIPLKTFTYPVKCLPFNSKDTAAMELNANFVWAVNDPTKVAVYPGKFKSLADDISYQVNLDLAAKCSTYNRNEILPTKQDVMIENSKDKTPEEIVECFAKAQETKIRIHNEITSYCLEQLVKTSSTCNWGIEIKDLVIKGFILKDPSIIESFTEITRSVISAQTAEARAEVEKKTEVAKAEVSMQKAKATADVEKKIAAAKAEVEMQMAQARASVEMKTAEANAEVQLQNARAKAGAEKQISIAKAQAEIEIAKAQAQVEVEKAKAETEADIVRAKADADARAIRLDIENREQTEKAKAQAEAENLLTDAEFNKATKKHEAEDKIPSHVIEMNRYSVISDMYKEVSKNFATGAYYDDKYLRQSIANVEGFVGQTLPEMMKHNTVIADTRAEGGNLTVKSGSTRQ